MVDSLGVCMHIVYIHHTKVYRYEGMHKALWLVTVCHIPVVSAVVHMY